MGTAAIDTVAITRGERRLGIVTAVMALPCTAVLTAFFVSGPGIGIGPAWILIFLAALLPYAHILWGLRKAPYGKGSMRAMVWGTALLVYGALMLLLAFGTREAMIRRWQFEDAGWTRGQVILFALPVTWIWLHGALLAAAVSGYRGGAAKAENRPSWAKEVGAVFLCGVVSMVGIAMAIPSLLMTNAPLPLEVLAVGAVRTLHTSVITYAATYPEKGCPPLRALGGPGGTAEAAGLIDDKLASGKKSGYEFTLLAAPASEAKDAAPCLISAQPLSMRGRRAGQRSYLVDAGGTIHYTVEDRAATAQDPPLQ